MIDGASCDHKAGVDGTTNDSSKRVPGSVIKPIVEIVKAFVCEVLSCTIIEIRIKFVND